MKQKDRYLRKMDKEYIDHPEKGVIQMTDFLLDEGYKVGQRRFRRLMRLTAIIDVYSRFIVCWNE